MTLYEANEKWKKLRFTRRFKLHRGVRIYKKKTEEFIGVTLIQSCFYTIALVKKKFVCKKHNPAANTLDLKHFSILKKCQSKLDCLIYEMFFY